MECKYGFLSELCTEEPITGKQSEKDCKTTPKLQVRVIVFEHQGKQQQISSELETAFFIQNNVISDDFKRLLKQTVEAHFVFDYASNIFIVPIIKKEPIMINDTQDILFPKGHPKIQFFRGAIT